MGESMIRDVGALILFSHRVSAVVRFYEAIGLELQPERHEDGPVHYVSELGPTHFAVFESPPGEAPEFKTGGSTFPGFTVDSLEDALSGARSVGARVVQEPTPYPWGMRVLVVDPDGRVIELFQRPKA
ncbi:MAG: VOC family protein [Thermoplasmata archaeon]